MPLFLDRSSVHGEAVAVLLPQEGKAVDDKPIQLASVLIGRPERFPDFSVADDVEYYHFRTSLLVYRSL